MPVLQATLRAARERTDALCDALDGDPSRALGDPRFLALLERADRTDGGVGWVLGVLAASRGTDLLRARRERRGARILADMVARSEGCELVPAADELPDVSPAVGEGWEAPYVLALAFCAACRGARGGALGWTMERGPGGWRLGFEGEGSARALRACQGELAARWPDVALQDGTLRLPGAWFAAAEVDA